MTYDFRASQVRTNKIIASGSTGTNAALLIYDHESDGIPPLQGNIKASFDTSKIGPDTFLYVSGSENKRSVIGGGLTLSGTVVALKGLPLGQDLPDLTYQQGLFESWTSNTTVGFAIKEINNLLKALAPARPPNLSSLSSNTQGVSAKLMVDTNKPFALHASVPDKPVDALYSSTGNILGVFASGSALAGKLANNVSIGAGAPFPAYAQSAINKGDSGQLKLIVNDSVVRTIDLATSPAVNDSTTGFVLSTTQSVLFSTTGIPFDGFKYRTGTWKIASDYQRLGYNSMKVVHDVDGTTIYHTNELQWFIGGDGNNITYSNEKTTDLVLTGTKYLSGVKYYTGGSFKYSITGSNVYDGSVYSPNIYEFTTAAALNSITSEYLPAADGDRTKQLEIQKTVNFRNSGIRLLDESVSLYLTVPTVFNGNSNSAGVSIQNILLDNIPDTNTETNENFTSEKYRIPYSLNFDTDIPIDSWNSQISIEESSPAVGYNNGLQVVGGLLKCGTKNWSVVTNGPVGNVDYSVANMGSGNRTFYRVFIGDVGSANFRLNIQGSGVSFIKNSLGFSATSQMKVEFKAPTQTGWLCAFDDFIGGQYSDGAGGRAASFGVGRALNQNWGLTIGVKNIVNSFNKIYLRLTVPYNFSGQLSNISFTFL